MNNSSDTFEAYNRQFIKRQVEKTVVLLKELQNIRVIPNIIVSYYAKLLKISLLINIP